MVNCMVNNETQHLVQIVSVDLVHLIVHKYISFILKKKKSEREREREVFLTVLSCYSISITKTIG